MTLHIRDGAPAERAALEDLQRRASLMWDEYRPYLLANPDAIALPLSQLTDGQVRVAEQGGHIAGFSAVLPRGATLFELDGLFVEPGAWGIGIGRALVVDLRTRLAPGAVLEVVANPYAEGFYRKLGFVPFARTQTQFGPADRMRHAVLDTPGLGPLHPRPGP